MTEFDKYEKLGPYHWHCYAIGDTYARHADRVAAWVTERPVLDAGCGDGLITYLLGKTGTAVGIDTSEAGIRLAREHGVEAEIGDVYRPPQAPMEGRWGAVYCGDVIEHLDKPEKAITALGKVTDVLYLATPPKQPRGLADHHHVREFTPAELDAMMGDLGWACTRQEVNWSRIMARYVRRPRRWRWWR